VDALEIATLLRGGLLPQAYAYPAGMRAARDLLRRRRHLVRKPGQLRAHIQMAAQQYNLPPLEKRIAYPANREGVAEHVPDRAVRQSIEVDLALLERYDELLPRGSAPGSCLPMCNAGRTESSFSWMRRMPRAIYGCPQGIAWSGSGEIEWANTASEPTTNGEPASAGSAGTPTTWRSRTTTERMKTMARKAHPPVHPGEILLEEFLEPMNLSQYRLAKDISVPARRINEIVHGKRGITADTALRLARYFGTTDHFWMNLQTRHDLEVEKARLKGRLARAVTVLKEAS